MKAPAGQTPADGTPQDFRSKRHGASRPLELWNARVARVLAFAEREKAIVAAQPAA